METASADPAVRVIRPSAGVARVDLRELWRYRELVLFFTWRNILVRYKQTVLGFAWAVLQPVALMVVLNIFFFRLGNVPSNGVPAPIFLYAALLPWTFFATSMAQSSNSLVGSANLLSKVYFPRVALPIATVLAALVDFVIASLVLVGLLLYYGVTPRGVAIGLVPALVLLVLVVALGVALWLSALNVTYRDVQYVVPFLTQLWFFSTVIYPTSLLAEPWRSIVGLNPMAGVVEGFRWALVSTERSPGLMVPISAGAAVVLLATGALYFRRAERSFADVI